MFLAAYVSLCVCLSRSPGLCVSLFTVLGLCVSDPLFPSVSLDFRVSGSLSVFPPLRTSCLAAQSPSRTGLAWFPTPTELSHPVSLFPFSWALAPRENNGGPTFSALCGQRLPWLCHHSGVLPKARGSWPPHLALLLSFVNVGI